MSVAPLLSGVVAGFGIAIPVGPIALLITEAGLRYGLRTAFFAGAGAATADLLYAATAAAAGSALILVLGPAEAAIRFVAALAVSIIGLAGLIRLRRQIRGLRGGASEESTPDNDAAGEADPPPGAFAVYSRFVGLTLLNPLTIGYFAALVVGSAPSSNRAVERALFVAGVAVASLTWQSLLAFFGASLRRRLTLNLRFVTDIIGNMIVVLLGVRLMIAAAHP
jgi:arginine exporter protein ArgO